MQPATHQQIADSDQSNFALIALGANLPYGQGTSEGTIRRAIEDLDAVFGGCTGKSRLYLTPAYPSGTGPDFVNAAVAIRTSKPALDILKTLHNIEDHFHRERAVRWGPRTLDLDLLAVGSEVLPDEATQTTWRQLTIDHQQIVRPDVLILPHPRIQDRGFVLVPLCDIAPDWRHPLIGETVRQMCDALPEAARAEIIAIGEA